MKSVFPLSAGLWWYPTAYAVFLVLQPFYQRGLNALDDSALKTLALVMFCLWSASTCVPFIDFFGNNFLSFVMLYAIVNWIKRCDPRFMRDPKRIAGMIAGGSLLALLSMALLDLVSGRMKLAGEHADYFMVDNARVLPVVIALGLFAWARQWKLQSRAVNLIAGLMFDIYLIHMYPSVKAFLFEKLFDLRAFAGARSLPLIVIGQAAVVFLLCAAVAMLRKGLFLLTFDRIGARLKRAWEKVN